MAKRKTQEQFEQDVYNKLGKNYKILSPYPGGHGKVLMQHLVCNNIFEKNVHDIITRSSGCPYCNGNKPALYNETWVKFNTPAPYHYIEGYINMTEKCKFHCDKCNIDFYQSPKRLINEHIYGCNCCPTKLWTNEEFLANLGEKCLQEYEILSPYVNIDTKIRFKHKVCGTEFEQTPYNFIYKSHKQYCPICYYKKSKGEVIIAQFLNNNQINYEKEFVFPDFPNKRFDFYIPILNTAIEFDGKQHFQFNEFLHNQNIENFQKQQERDIEKNQYCLSHQINLFRIPYYEIDNLIIILTKIFKEKSSTTIEKYLVTEQLGNKCSVSEKANREDIV